MTRVMYKTANPRDLKALAQTALKMPDIKHLLADCRTSLIKGLCGKIHELSEISALVGNAINDDPPPLLKDGGVIKDGFNPELDRLRNIIKNGKALLTISRTRKRNAPA